MIRASEGGHWYDRDGTPRYEVMRADGSGMRSATLADARKNGWYPGVTSIIKCAAAPQLEQWKQEQTMMSALTATRRPNENDEDFCARVMRDSQEEGRKARDRGTEIHAAIQGHFEGVAPSVEMLPYVQGVVAAIKANFGEQAWITEKAVAHAIGFGTKADLHCADLVLDFKGKDFTEADIPKLKTYDEHDMQLGATREALIRPGARCAIVYVSRTVPGLAVARDVDEPDLARGWDMFRGLLNYWKAKNKYWPELWRPSVKEAA